MQSLYTHFFNLSTCFIPYFINICVFFEYFVNKMYNCIKFAYSFIYIRMICSYCIIIQYADFFKNFYAVLQKSFLTLDKSALIPYNVGMEQLIVKPIAYIKSDFKEKFGIPRQSGRAALRAEIVFLPEYGKENAFKEIEGFSHLWLLFDFSENHRKAWSETVRPPRLGGNKRVGVFASRSPFRPNPIGLSCVKLLRLEKRENTVVLHVEGADLLDGTPILDVKPYLPMADCVENALSGYSEQGATHFLTVDFPSPLLEKIPANKRTGLIECLSDDPRPSYQNDPDRIYGMRFDEYEIKFTVFEDVLRVISVEKTFFIGVKK